MSDLTLDDEPPPPFLDRDWSKPSKAVIASFAVGGKILTYAGPDIESMIEDAGSCDIHDLGLDADAPNGISIWEGVIKTSHTHTPDCNEYDSWLAGKFREPTEEEWRAIRRGECPWTAP